MNPERSKLRHQQRSDQNLGITPQTQQASGHKFSTVEDLLRMDRELHPVPPEVADRVNASISAEPKPKKPWYKSLFGA